MDGLNVRKIYYDYKYNICADRGKGRVAAAE